MTPIQWNGSATKAALRHVLAYFNGHLVCSREIEGASIKQVRRAQAERIFSKGKEISVERREMA